ncbi:MAG: hypothetical protein LLF28_06495 [Nitrospiraceae bacterium]|nr:hypothetical protein [Nitrospiraceae bacterium]
MKVFLKTLAAISLIFLLTPFSSAGERLAVKQAATDEIKGTFTLIMFGGRHFNDIETVAILDLEGDEYTIEPYSAEYNYKVEKGLSARDAIAKAEQSINWHRAYWRTNISKILDKKGNVIGYEFRPYYKPYEFGFADVLDIDYFLKGNKVSANIRLIPMIEQKFKGFDGGDFKNGFGK